MTMKATVVSLVLCGLVAHPCANTSPLDQREILILSSSYSFSVLLLSLLAPIFARLLANPISLRITERRQQEQKKSSHRAPYCIQRRKEIILPSPSGKPDMTHSFELLCFFCFPATSNGLHGIANEAMTVRHVQMSIPNGLPPRRIAGMTLLLSTLNLISSLAFFLPFVWGIELRGPSTNHSRKSISSGFFFVGYAARSVPCHMIHIPT